MSKKPISKLFLYRHRFVIGYIILAFFFISLITIIPTIAPNGLSESEMQSAVTSYNINFKNITTADIVDLPYHLLQKISILAFGLNAYSIKLPSIIIGGLLGFLLILLLNRWFKNNVAIIASVFTVLSATFLYIAGSGTPLIMLVFWPTLLLWLGSKIQGKGRPRPIWSFVFAFMLLLSVFTPYLIYLDIFIVIYVLAHPHLRFTIKSLPKVPLILVAFIIAGGIGFLVMNILKHPSTATALLFMDNFSWSQILQNLKDAFLPFFAWNGNLESVFLSPLVGLATLALAVVGLISTAKGFFASRNSIASYLIIFTIIISCMCPSCSVLLILPLSILVAHGIRYILNKWYGLFPENPYARVFGLIPISIFLVVMIISDIAHFAFGYRYNPQVANNFTTDLELIKENVDSSVAIIIKEDTLEYDFYSILEEEGYTIDTHLPIKSAAATLGAWDGDLGELKLKRIITSSKSQNSDRIYIYR